MHGPSSSFDALEKEESDNVDLLIDTEAPQPAQPQVKLSPQLACLPTREGRFWSLPTTAMPDQILLRHAVV